MTTLTQTLTIEFTDGTNMKITIFDVATGVETTRDCTSEEETSFNNCVTSADATHKIHDDAVTKKETDQAAATTKLKALGLTDDEIGALIN